MSNKMTIRRPPQPVKKSKGEEKPKPAKRRRGVAGIIPAIVFIGVAVWYFISSMK